MNLLSLHLRNPQTMPERFAWIMDALFCAIFEQATRIPDWFLHKATRRIRRFGNQVNRILAALQAGTYRAPKSHGPRKPAPPPAAAIPDAPIAAELPQAAPATTPPERLPHRRGWLLQAMAGRYSGSQFEHLLTDPELIAAIHAAPALARPLRGLCHMLGIPLPDLIRLPKRPRKPREPKPKREKPKKFAIYKYWMRSSPLGAARKLRLRKKTSKW